MKDAIIILGGGVNHDKSIKKCSLIRLEKGVELLKNGISKNLILSGKYSFWLDESNNIPSITEAQSMFDKAISLGVLKDQLFLEEESKDTFGNAYFTKINFLEKNNWKNVVVVTSEYHIPRTKIIFDRVLGPEYNIEYIGVDNLLSKEREIELKNKEEKTIQFIEKTLNNIKSGDTNAIKDFLFKKHPGYSENPEISFSSLKNSLEK